jgi:hypothetical protein
MKRRQFIAATGIAVVATLAGCSDDGSDGSDGSGGGSSGPEGVVEDYTNALDNGDFDQVESLIHSESALSGRFENEEELARALEEADISLDNTEVIEEGDEMAIVEATITGATGEGETDTQEIELRKEDGDWKIYADGTVGA